MALLDRVLQRGTAPGELIPNGSGLDEVEESRMTVLQHLEALRRVLIVCMAALTITSVVAFFFWTKVVYFLVAQGRVTDHLVFTTPTGGFTLGIKVAIIVGIIAASPVWIQQIWWFVSPGLHRHERRLILPLILATILFFAIGVAFALFALPLFLHILSGFAPKQLVYLPVGDDYINFVLFLVLGFGVVFELPVVLFVLGLIGIVSSKWLYSNRFYWIIGLGVLSNIMTPGVDPITPLFMWVPLYVFWEGTALLLKLTGR